MNDACTEIAPLLAAGPLGILDDESRARVDRHLATGCLECQSFATDVFAALGSKKLAAVEAPMSALENVLGRVAREDGARANGANAPGAVGSAAPSALACADCRKPLVRREAVFCAGCLAPVHERCFLERGRCVSPGCSETRIVRPSEPAMPQRSAGPRRSSPLWLVGLVASGAVAALAGDRLLRGREAPAPSTLVAVSPGPAVVVPPRALESGKTPGGDPTPEIGTPRENTPVVAPTPLAHETPTGPVARPQADGLPAQIFEPWNLPSASLVLPPAPRSPVMPAIPERKGPGVLRSGVFLRAALDLRGMPNGVELKDGTALPLSPDLTPEQLRKIQAILLTVNAGTKIELVVLRGAVTEVTKGWPTEPKAEPELDPLTAMRLQPGDTVRVGLLVTGMVDSATPQDLSIREWNHGSWGEVKTFDRAKLPSVERIALRSSLQLPDPNGGEGVVGFEVERLRDRGSSSPLRLKATVWHSLGDRMLSGAVLRFEARRVDGTKTFAPESEDVLVPAIFAGDRFTIERTFDDKASGLAEGHVTIELDPARSLLPATSDPGKAAALTALATRTSELGPVWAFLGQTRDRDLARLLAWTRIQLPETTSDLDRRALDEALEASGGAAPEAIVSSVLAGDSSYRLPEATADGRLRWREASAQAITGKRQELALLARLPAALQDGRGKALLGLYLERGSELGENVLAVFTARVKDAVDSLIGVIVEVGCSSNPSAEEIRRAESATNVIRRLGDPALEAVLDRLKDLAGKKGELEARKLRALPVRDAESMLARALEVIIFTQKSEVEGQLDRTLEGARAKVAEHDWAGALALVESVLHRDRENADARKLERTVLVGRAKQELGSGRRGEAAILLERALAGNPRGSEAYAILGKILLDAASEDAAAVCVRAGPGETWEAVLRPTVGQSLRIALVKEPTEDWIPVELPGATGRAPAWIHLSNGIATHGGERIDTVSATGAPALIRETLARAVRLAPELSPAADAVDGELWLRAAEVYYAAGLYPEALAHYDRGARLLPGDERLGHRFACQLRVNAPLLAILAACVALLVAFGIVRLRTRRSPETDSFPGKKSLK